MVPWGGLEDRSVAHTGDSQQQLENARQEGPLCPLLPGDHLEPRCRTRLCQERRSVPNREQNTGWRGRHTGTGPCSAGRRAARGRARKELLQPSRSNQGGPVPQCWPQGQKCPKEACAAREHSTQGTRIGWNLSCSLKNQDTDLQSIQNILNLPGTQAFLPTRRQTQRGSHGGDFSRGRTQTQPCS